MTQAPHQAFIAAPIVEIAAASPAAIAERLYELARLLGDAYAANTQRVWRANWKVWCGFCVRRDVAPFPTDLATIEAFLRERIRLGRKRATLEQYLYTLHLVHKLADLPDPMKTIEGELLWKGLCRTSLRKAQVQRKPLGERELQRITDALSESEPIDLRDRALLWVGYETLMRRSELQRMKVEDIDFSEDETPSVIWLERSKTDQEGEGQYRPISPRTARYLKDWLAGAGIESGFVWRSIPPAFRKTPAYTIPLSDKDVARIFKRRAGRAGIKDELIAGHSTRVGAAQDLVANGANDTEVMQAGGWSTTRMVARYSAKIRAKDNAMMRLQKARERG